MFGRLQGKHALVVDYQAQRNRYTLELTNGSRKLIHANNLSAAPTPEPSPPQASDSSLDPGTRCIISGLSRETHLNGQTCQVVSRKGERLDVQLLDGSLKSAKRENLHPTSQPPVGEQVTPENAIEGAMVERGRGWTWDDQDGGSGCVGRIRAVEVNWAWVQWNSGISNLYRIGAHGSFDLQFVDDFKHEAACQKALQGGKSQIRPQHLDRTFAYLLGRERAHVDFFDVRDEVCQALGECRHGERVQVEGIQAVAIGVAPVLHTLHMFFHVDCAEGAGIFDDEARQKMKLLSRQKVREAERPRMADNKELMEISKTLELSFQYVVGFSYTAVHLDRFDIRDDICLKVGGFKHGQVVKSGGCVAAVVGVRLVKDIPRLFFHFDGKAGAWIFELDSLTVVPASAHSPVLLVPFCVMSTRDASLLRWAPGRWRKCRTASWMSHHRHPRLTSLLESFSAPSASQLATRSRNRRFLTFETKYARQ